MSRLLFGRCRKQRLIELFLYGVFGLLAFLVNVGAFSVFSSMMHLHYLLSDALAWISATLFAFFTNKLIVFRSGGNAVRESAMFLAARLFTLAMDMVLMLFFVGIIGVGSFAAKIVVNGVVIVTNYVMSRYIVFKGRKSLCESESQML